MLLQQKGYRPGAAAPHAPEGAYPGTCRDLTDAERETPPRRDRPPAGAAAAHRRDRHTVHDLLHGEYTGIVDDFVVRRGDGVPPTTSPSSSTTQPRASTRSCAATTCCRRRPGRRTSPRLLGHRSRRTRMSPWCSTRTGRGWPNATAPSRWPRSACSARWHRSPNPLAGRRRAPTEMLAQFDPAKLPRQPWIDLAELDMFVDVQVGGDQLMEMAPILEPSGVRVLIDHCGRPVPAAGLISRVFGACSIWRRPAGTSSRSLVW